MSSAQPSLAHSRNRRSIDDLSAAAVQNLTPQSHSSKKILAVLRRSSAPACWSERLRARTTVYSLARNSVIYIRFGRSVEFRVHPKGTFSQAAWKESKSPCVNSGGQAAFEAVHKTRRPSVQYLNLQYLNGFCGAAISSAKSFVRTHHIHDFARSCVKEMNRQKRGKQPVPQAAVLEFNHSTTLITPLNQRRAPRTARLE